MKPHNNFTTRLRLFGASALFVGAVALTASVWLIASSQAYATPNQCTVCHKRTQTLVLACNSLDYQRHLDHGDPPNACATMTAVDAITAVRAGSGGAATTPPSQ